MDLPTVLYRCPGPHSRAGGTYDFLGVETEEAHDAAMAAGWQLTMPEAIDAYEAKVAEVKAEVERELDAEVKVKGKPGPKPKAQ